MIHFMTHDGLGNSKFSFFISWLHPNIVKYEHIVGIYSGCKEEKQLPWTDRDSDGQLVTENIDQSQKKKGKKKKFSIWKDIKFKLHANSLSGNIPVQTGLDNWDIPTWTVW